MKVVWALGISKVSTLHCWKNKFGVLCKILTALLRDYSSVDTMIRLGFKASFIWKSLLEGRGLLKKGLQFLIGDGNTTSAWLDPWLDTHPPRPPQKLDGINS